MQKNDNEEINNEEITESFKFPEDKFMFTHGNITVEVTIACNYSYFMKLIYIVMLKYHV